MVLLVIFLGTFTLYSLSSEAEVLSDGADRSLRLYRRLWRQRGCWQYGDAEVHSHVRADPGRKDNLVVRRGTESDFPRVAERVPRWGDERCQHRHLYGGEKGIFRRRRSQGGDGNSH